MGTASGALALLLVVLGASVSSSGGQLQVGFYSKSCPSAESTVASVVRGASAADSTILPALLRLQFHDCFVRVRVRRVGADQGREQQRGGGQRQAPGAPRDRRDRERQGAARVRVPRRGLVRRRRRPRRPRRRRIHRRAVVRRADGAARREGVQRAGRRRAAGRARLRPGAPLQVPRQRPRRQGPRPPQLGAHGGHDGVLLHPGPALQLPAPGRRGRVGPVDPGRLPVGAQVPVRAGGLQHAAVPGPRQRARVRHLHPPQHPQRLRRDRLRRRALQRHDHRGRGGLLLGPPQHHLRALLPAGLRGLHGEDGQHRRAHRRQRGGPEGLLQVQLRETHACIPGSRFHSLRCRPEYWLASWR